MDLREQIRRRHKDSRFIIGGLSLLLVLLTLVYAFIQRSRDLPSDLVTNKVLLFVLWYANVVLILTIVFVLLRNLLKLLVERHHRILGSKFKTKLLATYIGLSLLPGLLLFAYGSRLLQGWIDRWFDEPAVTQVAAQGHAVALALDRHIEATRLRDSARVLREIEDVDLANARRRPQLDRRLRRLLAELELDYLAVYERTDFVQALLNPQAGLTDLPELDPRFLLEALKKGEAVRIVSPSAGEERLILTAVAAAETAGNPRPVVIGGQLLDAELASKSRQLVQAFQGYRQLELRKSEIEAGYVLTFMMVTLLILLASSWVGLYLARRVTVPIQALAEGTRRISEGDLDYRVEVDAGDELAVLVESFNRMTAELARNKELLEEGNVELVAANRRLAEERAVIAAVLENVAAGVISVGEDARILTCNGAALAMLGQSEEQVVGRPAREAWSDGERGKLAELFEGEPREAGRTVQDVRLLLGGEWKSFEAKVTTMRDPRGEVGGRVMVLEELTELVKAQQMAAWSEAARRIAHEIKNPLTPIKLSAERLLRKWRQQDPDLGSALEEAVELISNEVRAMKGMVDEFSRFARMPRPRPAEVDLRKLVDETLNLYAGLKPGVEVRGQVEPAAQTAWLDGEQLKRALINLLDNALAATDAPGEVKVSVHRQDGHLEIDVADSGSGIPADAKDKLFLPHFSTKGRGTGLGLSIVHRIVAEHHGTIRAEENKPRGTVFRIRLPQQ